MFNKIIVGLDFEKLTNEVVSYACYLSLKTNSYLYFINVIDYIMTPPAYLLKYIDEEKRLIREKFLNIENKIKIYNIKFGFDIVIGRLHDSFEKTISDKGPEMLIIGFVRHQFRRSSSEKLIKGLKIPMLVVKDFGFNDIDINKISIKKILCPVDMSEYSKKALNFTIELSKILSSEFSPLYVTQKYLVNKKTLNIDELDNYSKVMFNEDKKKYMNFLLDFHCEDKGILIEGDPYKDIINYANLNKYDLIVMGARGLGLIKGLFIGSVTDCVLKTSNCPVFVVH